MKAVDDKIMLGIYGRDAMLALNGMMEAGRLISLPAYEFGFQIKTTGIFPRGSACWMLNMADDGEVYIKYDGNDEKGFIRSFKQFIKDRAVLLQAKVDRDDSTVALRVDIDGTRSYIMGFDIESPDADEVASIYREYKMYELNAILYALLKNHKCLKGIEAKHGEDAVKIIGKPLDPMKITALELLKKEFMDEEDPMKRMALVDKWKDVSENKI